MLAKKKRKKILKNNIVKSSLSLNESSSTSFTISSVTDKPPVTARDIFMLHDEKSSLSNETHITYDNPTLTDSNVYSPLEEVSLASVFHHEVSFLPMSNNETDKESLDSMDFPLSRSDPNYEKAPSEFIKIILNETETFMLFELPQKVYDTRELSSELIKSDNERYKRLLRDGNLSRHMISSETQTINPSVKNCYTQLSKIRRYNRGTYVNHWIMYDDFKVEKTSTEIPCKMSLADNAKVKSVTEQLFHIYYNTRFREAVRVILRILASNTYKMSQKLYKGLVEETISDPERKPTYELKLLWTYTIDQVRNRIVSAFAWNVKDHDLMAVGYGPPMKFISSDSENIKGLLLIWCAKNPQDPERSFDFESPISALDWSTSRPSWIVVGFYNGEVQVVDISGETLMVVKKCSGIDSRSHKPHWDVQWWINNDNSMKIDESFNSTDSLENEIYTANQDGRIQCYSMEKNFEATEMTRVHRSRKQSYEVQHLRDKNDKDILLFEYAAAILLKRFPLQNSEYLVGSDEGYIFRYSNDEPQRPVNHLFAHNGPVYSLEFSPFCHKIFVTSGADRSARIWCDGLTEPLITLLFKKTVVKSVVWSPTNPVILASINDTEIWIWDLASKTYEPMSVTTSPHKKSFYSLKFTVNGKQLIASDIDGNIFTFHLQNMSIANYDKRKTLIKFIEKAMVLKPDLLQDFRNKIFVKENLESVK